MGITRKRVQTLCSQDRILRVTRFGREWVISADTERSTEGCVSTGEYKNCRKKDKINCESDKNCHSNIL